MEPNIYQQKQVIDLDWFLFMKEVYENLRNKMKSDYYEGTADCRGRVHNNQPCNNKLYYEKNFNNTYCWRCLAEFLVVKYGCFPSRYEDILNRVGWEADSELFFENGGKIKWKRTKK